MKIKQKLLVKMFLVTIFLMFLSSDPVDIYGQQKCSKPGEQQNFTFQNETIKPVEIKVLDSDCKEGIGKLLKAGDKAGGSSFVGIVFRIYEFGTGKLISEVVLEKSKSIYKIEDADNENPTKSAVKVDPTEDFLKETNKIRAEKNLSPMQLDQRLSNACQWFAELMAEVDKGHPAHTAKELGMGNSYKNRNKASQRLVFYGWEKRNTVHFEVTALDTVQDQNKVGSHFAKGWAGTKTHYQPFYDKDKYKYNRVGFGVAKAERGKNRYYACAIFGRI